MELLLTNEQAQKLIKLFKTAMNKHRVIIKEKSKGKISLKSFENQREFKLCYYYCSSKKVFHFMDNETNHTLFRVTLSNNFHKNADGTRIKGNRINIFSEEEYHAQVLMGNTSTHYRCFKLPFDSIKETSDFFEMFEEICKYANIEKQNMIEFQLEDQGSLFN